MLKRVLCLAVALALVLATGVLAGAEDRVYINGIDANFPPFAYVDENGNAAGFDVDAMNWIAEKMGFQVTHQPMDWDGIVASLVAEKIDLVASGMSITEERAQQVDFTIPYWIIKQVMVVQGESDLTVEDVLTGGKILGVQRGTSEADWLAEQLEANEAWNFDLRYYDSAPLAVEDVLNGRIDAAAMDDAPAQDAVNRKPVKIIGTFGMHEENFGYAVRKTDPELLQMLNDGLTALMADPYWDELIAKHELNAQ